MQARRTPSGGTRPGYRHELARRVGIHDETIVSLNTEATALIVSQLTASTCAFSSWAVCSRPVKVSRNMLVA